METESTNRPTTLGPSGMELRPEPPKGMGLSRRGGILALIAVGGLVALIIYGIFARQNAAAGWSKRGGDSDKRVTGAKEAAKQFSNPSGSPVEEPESKDLDPPPLTFLPRGREAKPVPVVRGQAPVRNTSRTGPVNTVPTAARVGVVATGAAFPPGPPAGWDPPANWSASGPAGGSATTALSKREEREREAMEAGTGIGAGGSRVAQARGEIGELAGLVNSLSGSSGGGAGPRAMAPSNHAISGAPAPPRDPDDEGSADQDGKAEFLRNARGKGGSSNYVQSTRMKPMSPFEIKAGWDIPAVLEQEINSDLPGEIRALVRENVYDTASGQYLLIPQGSRLVGKYDSRVAYAQNALLVVWDRIIFPDASSIDLEGMAAQDVRGRTGLRDKVNHHYARVFGAAVLSTAFSAAAVVAQNRRQNVFTLPSSQDVAASAAASEIARLGAAVTRKNLNVQPTIRIRAGHRFSVRVHKDLLFEAPYRPYSHGESGAVSTVR